MNDQQRKAMELAQILKYNPETGQFNEQEPVAKYIGECGEGSLVQLYEDVKKGTNFYSTPPPRVWFGLTDEEVGALTNGMVKGWVLQHLVTAIEAKLKKKNNG